jgi:hypothetical protein
MAVIIAAPRGAFGFVRLYVIFWWYDTEKELTSREVHAFSQKISQKDRNLHASSTRLIGLHSTPINLG